MSQPIGFTGIPTAFQRGPDAKWRPIKPRPRRRRKPRQRPAPFFSFKAQEVPA